MPVVQQHGDGNGQSDAHGVHMTCQSLDPDAGTDRAPERRAELRVRRLVRGKGPGIDPLDHEQDRGGEAPPAGGDQVREVRSPSGGGRIGEERHTVLHQGDGFHL